MPAPEVQRRVLTGELRAGERWLRRIAGSVSWQAQAVHASPGREL